MKSQSCRVLEMELKTVKPTVQLSHVFAEWTKKAFVVVFGQATELNERLEDARGIERTKQPNEAARVSPEISDSIRQKNSNSRPKSKATRKLRTLRTHNEMFRTKTMFKLSKLLIQCFDRSFKTSPFLVSISRKIQSTQNQKGGCSYECKLIRCKQKTFGLNDFRFLEEMMVFQEELRY